MLKLNPYIVHHIYLKRSEFSRRQKVFFFLKKKSTKNLKVGYELNFLTNLSSYLLKKFLRLNVPRTLSKCSFPVGYKLTLSAYISSLLCQISKTLIEYKELPTCDQKRT